MRVDNIKKIGMLFIFLSSFHFAASAQVSDKVKRQLFKYLVEHNGILADDMRQSYDKALPQIKEVKFYPDSSCTADQKLYKFGYLATHLKSFYCLVKGDQVTFLRNDKLKDLLEDISKYINSLQCIHDDKSVDLVYRKVMNGYQMYRYESNAGY